MIINVQLHNCKYCDGCPFLPIGYSYSNILMLQCNLKYNILVSQEQKTKEKGLFIRPKKCIEDNGE